MSDLDRCSNPDCSCQEKRLINSTGCNGEAPPSTGPTVDACGKPMGTINGNPFACNRPDKHEGNCTYTFPPVGYCCENGTFDTPHNCQKQPGEAATSEGATPTGQDLYLALARTVIARILEADANCDPPHDIMLRLESIIRDRDTLRARLAEVEREREEQKDAREFMEGQREIEAQRARNAEARVEELEKALRDVVNERDTELDMMRCEYRHGTPENKAWHDGVREAWKRFDIVKAGARSALEDKR